MIKPLSHIKPSPINDEIHSITDFSDLIQKINLMN